MPSQSDTTIIKELVEQRQEIAEGELALRRARIATRTLTALVIAVPATIIAMIVANGFFGSFVDLAPYYTVALTFVIPGGLAATGIAIASADSGGTLLKPRQLEIELDAMYDAQALYFSGANVDLSVRQYAFRGGMQRNITATRTRGNGYRNVNNFFQSLIIIGSLATTTAASLNASDSPLKWVAVGLSLVVGISAGLTGYFKYRERAFYLRQTADEMESELNAYDLGLPPYDNGGEPARIALLTARTEAIRKAQQEREQQLDQPKAREET